MKNIICLMVVALLALPAIAADVEQFVAVQLLDNVKQTTHQVVTPAEYKALQEDVIQKNSLLSRAVKMAQEEWKGLTSVEGAPFPQGVGTPSKVRMIGIYTEKTKAETAIADVEAKMPDEDAPKSTYMTKRIEALKEALKNPPADTPKVSRQTWINNTTEELKLLEGIVAKREARKAAREKLVETASGLVLAKIVELQAGVEEAEVKVEKKIEKKDK